MKIILAIDAGGTGTRALLLDSTGRCLGYGRAGGGNPTSAGIDNAAAAIGSAAQRALSTAMDFPGVSSETAGAEAKTSLAVIALAGQNTQEFRDRVISRLAPLGFPEISVQPDLLGMFHSGTFEPDGHVLIAGTGTVAARVSGSTIEREGGGTGWLLGDEGSGFWIGHHVVRAVVASLDGGGRDTALTQLLLDELGIVPEPGLSLGRPVVLHQLMAALYALRPVELSRFAPLAFRAEADPVALELLVAASAALADLLSQVRAPGSEGTIVVGGSVLLDGILAAPPALASRLVPIGEGARLVPVPDGVVGAAVLALRAVGTPIDDDLFRRVQAGLAELRAASKTASA